MSARMKWDGARMEAEFRRASEQTVEEIALTLQTEIKQELSKPGRGRLYRRSKGWGRRQNTREQGSHRASAPGDPPAVDTGTLRRSYQYTDAPGRANPARIVGTAMAVARFLEFGTRKMAARPHVRPSTDRVDRKVPEIAAKHVRAALGRLNR